MPTHDIQEVANKAVHACREALDPLCVPRTTRVHWATLRRLLSENRSVQRDATKQGSEIVTDHAEEVVPRGDRVVGPRALDQKAVVGRLPFEAQERRDGAIAFVAFDMESLVRAGLLSGDEVVFLGTLRVALCPGAPVEVLGCRAGSYPSVPVCPRGNA